MKYIVVDKRVADSPPPQPRFTLFMHFIVSECLPDNISKYLSHHYKAISFI